MIRNALLEMKLFTAARETENKYRWDAPVDETTFSLYIPKWRVPSPAPARIYVALFPRRYGTDDLPNLAPDDVKADPCLVLEPIVATVTAVTPKTKTIRYAPTGDPKKWEIGDPYVPFSMTYDGNVSLRIFVMWDLTSRGAFHAKQPVAT
jgi:hypothetical protein